MKYYDVVNCVSDFLNMAQFLFYEISKNDMKKNIKSFPLFDIK